MTLTKEERRDMDPFSLPPATRRMRAFSTFIFFVLGFLLAAFLFWNPFGVSFLPMGPKEHVHEEEVAAAKKTRLWTCPMDPQVVEKEPGDCPICGMKLVPMGSEEEARQEGPPTTEQTQFWTCPMDPQVVEKEPGICPICNMKLVPLATGEDAGSEGAVKLDPAIVQQIGVRTEPVRMGELRNVVRTVGILDYNEKNIFWVNTKFDGWIEKVYLNYIGEAVRKGQRLFEVYSPELVSTQEEYLTSMKYLEKMKEAGSREAVRQAEALMAATRKRLSYWDVTEDQIRRLERTGEVAKTLTVVSPVKGRLVEKMDAALEGMYAKAGMNLYKIADLSTVWVHADVYESQLKWVRPGLETEITFPYFPGEHFTGKVLFMYPFLEEKTRTMKACVEVKNPKGRLEPGMYADIRIRPVASPRALMIPEDAVIRTGERNVVFVALGEGRFLPREVELGIKGEGGVYEIRKGLREGEQVVVSAQFLLDSESRLQEFIRKLTAAPEDQKS